MQLHHTPATEGETGPREFGFLCTCITRRLG